MRLICFHSISSPVVHRSSPEWFHCGFVEFCGFALRPSPDFPLHFVAFGLRQLLDISYSSTYFSARAIFPNEFF